MAAFGGNHMSTFYFRWKPSFYFWKVVGHGNGQNCEKTTFGVHEDDAFPFHQWQLLVFVKISSINELNDCLKNTLIGQDKMRCDIHKTF